MAESGCKYSACYRIAELKNRRTIIRNFLCTFGLFIVFILPASAGEPADDAAQMIRDKFGDYHAGDWDAWKSKYSDDARIFYNSVDTSLTVDEAVTGHVRSIVPLRHYEFRDEETRISVTLDENGNVRAHFNGVWRATFSATDESIAVPTAVEYSIVDGKIIEERGYWDNQILIGPYTRAAKASETESSE